MKKILAFIIMGLLMVGGVSCGEKDEAIGETVAVVGEHAQKGEFDYDEAIQNIVLYGNKVKMPCNFSGLGSGFSTKGGKVLESGIGTYFNLYYNGEEVGSVVLDNCEADDDVSGKKIVRLDIMNTDDCYIDGLKLTEKFEAIQQAFGSPTYTNDQSVKYAAGETKYVEFRRASKNSKDIVEVSIYNG